MRFSKPHSHFYSFWSFPHSYNFHLLLFMTYYVSWYKSFYTTTFLAAVFIFACYHFDLSHSVFFLPRLRFVSFLWHTNGTNCKITFGSYLDFKIAKFRRLFYDFSWHWNPPHIHWPWLFPLAVLSLWTPVNLLTQGSLTHMEALRRAGVTQGYELSSRFSCPWLTLCSLDSIFPITTWFESSFADFQTCQGALLPAMELVKISVPV